MHLDYWHVCPFGRNKDSFTCWSVALIWLAQQQSLRNFKVWLSHLELQTFLPKQYKLGTRISLVALRMFSHMVIKLVLSPEFLPHFPSTFELLPELTDLSPFHSPGLSPFFWTHSLRPGALHFKYIMSEFSPLGSSPVPHGMTTSWASVLNGQAWNLLSLDMTPYLARNWTRQSAV